MRKPFPVLFTLLLSAVLAVPPLASLNGPLFAEILPARTPTADKAPPAEKPLKIPEPVVCPCRTASPPGGEPISLGIECHSGTPPVLEFLLEDPERKARAILFDFESDGKIDLELRNVREGVVFRGVPYREKGTYTLSAFIETDRGSLKREYLLSFVDFLWGRDNFDFANDGKFENDVEFVSKTVLDWAEDRFGDVTRDDEALIRYLMYTLYKGSIGRCYGFTGLQMLYMENPDLVPAPYRSIYSIDEKDERIIRSMDWLQNDMVFANFVSGRKRLSSLLDSRPLDSGSLDAGVRRAEPREELRAELREILGSILRGKPIIFGYIGNELHHAMVVYGFFNDLTGGKTTLLTANNWVRGQRDNVYSEDAENVVIDLENEEQPVTWFDVTKKKYRHIERFFAVGVQDSYELNRKYYTALLESTKNRIVENGRVIIMVENTQEAYVVDGAGNKSGYVKKETLRESETVLFKKIDYNYVFEVPVRDPVTLVLNMRIFNKEKSAYKDVNLYGIIPAPTGFQHVVVTGLQVPFLSPLTLSVSGNGIAVTAKP